MLTYIQTCDVNMYGYFMIIVDDIFGEQNIHFVIWNTCLAKAIKWYTDKPTCSNTINTSKEVALRHAFFFEWTLNLMMSLKQNQPRIATKLSVKYYKFECKVYKKFYDFLEDCSFFFFAVYICMYVWICSLFNYCLFEERYNFDIISVHYVCIYSI